MRNPFKSLVLAFITMFAGIAASAQVTTASLGGRVVDQNGEPVIGAAIVAIHEPSGTSYGSVTNVDGLYTIQGMRTGGPYRVEVSCLGYQQVNYTDVTLSLAETFNLNAQLPESSEFLSEAVVIAAPTSKFAAVEKTGASTNISSRQMIEMPTISRSFSDMAKLSPYGGNGMNFSGSSGRSTNFTVDGANVNNNFGLSAALPGGGNPISLDAIEEMQVVVSPYDVRQSNFIGGGINAITKSGTNTFKGTAYIYYQNENMHGNRVDGVDLERTPESQATYGFTLGGPIVKNKLFFFVNAERIPSPSEIIKWRPSQDGVEDETRMITRVKESEAQQMKDFLIKNYGYDPGSYNDYHKDQGNLKLLARLDWNISQKHHLALRYNYTINNVWNSPNATSMDGGTRMSGGRMSQYSMAYANNMYSMNNVVNTWSLDLNSRLTDNLSNQFLATFSKLDDIRGSNSEEFPHIDILKDDNNYISLGYELFTWNNAVHNTVANVKDDLTWYAGKHKVTGGINFEYQMADNQYMRNGTGYYRYTSLEDFLTGAAPEIVDLTYGYDGEKAPAARVQFYKAGLYVQDEWSVSDRFKLTYGTRLDGLYFDNSDLMTNNAILALKYYPASHNYEETSIDTGKWPTSKVTVSPRIGFSWDVLGNRKVKVRGGTGLFSGRLPLVFFTNMPTNGGLVQYQAQINAKNAKAKGFSMDEFAGGLVTDANGKATVDALLNKLHGLGYPSTVSPKDGSVPSSISAVDPNFKMPQVWKTSLALDVTFPVSFPFTLTAEGIFNKTINAVSISDWSMANVGGFARVNGADNRPIYPSDFRGGRTKAFVLENTPKGYGWSANVQLNMQPIESLSLMAAYTHTVSKEITGMPGSAAESAFTYVSTSEGPNYIPLHNSQYVTPDRVVASLTHHDQSGNHYSLIYEAWRGGYNYSYMLTNDMNGDGYAYDAVYIPTDAEVSGNQFRFVSKDDADRFMAYVHKDPYLSKHQGEYAEAYSLYSPWVHRFDISYKHDFAVKIGNTRNVLQLSADIKNFLNLFNSSWGVAKYLNPAIGSEARILKYEGVDGEGFATFSTPAAISGSVDTFAPFHALSQCWYASIGIKYLFN